MSQRDLEVLAVAAILSSVTLGKKAYSTLTGSDFLERDLGALFDAVREYQQHREQQGQPEWHGPPRTLVNPVIAWMERQGVEAKEGKAVENVITELAKRSQWRKRDRLATKLSLAVAAGDTETAQECLDALNKKD